MKSTEQIKQLIAIELENARLWGMFLLPSIGLAMALFFGDQYLRYGKLTNVAFGTLVTHWTLFVIYMRSHHLRRAGEQIEKL